MKFIKNYIVTFFVVGLALLSFAGCSMFQSTKAIDYNDKIVKMQSEIIQSTLDLASSFSNNPADPAQLKSKHQQLIQVIDKNIAALDKLEKMSNDEGLKDSAMALFKFYRQSADNEYKSIVDILSKPELIDEDIEKINQLSDEFAKKEEPIHNQFMKSQEDFAKKYNFRLQENPLDKEIEKANS